MPFVERDANTRFYFEEAGRGGPSLLFVHGLACDLTDFTRLMAAFQSRHRVVAVDLRGHGKSTAAPSEGLAIADYVLDVEWLCRELGLRRPVLVGHSMGGIVGAELGSRMPALLSGVVSLDSAICIPTAAWGTFGPHIAALHGDSWREALIQLIGGYRNPTRDPRRHQHLLERMTSAPQATFTRAFDTLAQWQGDAVLSACRQPLLHVASGLPVDDVRLRRLNPDVRIERADAGHYPHIEVTDHIIAVLQSFLDSLANPRECIHA